MTDPFVLSAYPHYYALRDGHTLTTKGMHIYGLLNLDRFTLAYEEGIKKLTAT